MWPDDAVALAGSEKVMTLATYSDKGPWSAPVYYIFKGKDFYFFSKKSSRHIVDTGTQIKKTGKNRMAGGSIFSDSPIFDKIKGLQMTGRIEPVSNRKEALAVTEDYIKRFIREMAKKVNIGSINGLQYIMQTFHVSLYKFIPESVYYMDNSIKLGFRKRLMP